MVYIQWHGHVHRLLLMNGESMEDEAIYSVNTYLIVALNVCEVGGLSEARSLVKVSQVCQMFG